MANAGSAISGGLSGAATGAALGGPVGAGIGGAIGVLGGLFGGDDHSDEIDALRKEAAGLYDKFGPVDLSNPITFKQFQQAGLISPQMVQAINLENDKKLELQENPENREGQQKSLNALKQLSQTGLGPEDLAAFRQLQSKVGGDEEAKRKQILQSSQMRGQGGGGGDALASQLMSAQSSAQNASAEADRMAASAASARREALSNLFTGQSQVRGQDFNTANANNQNELLRRQFLDQNAVARQNANVQAQNQANLYNTNRQQNVNDQNTSVGNQELLREQNAKRQYWADQMAHANARAGALTGQANALAGQDANSAQGMQNIFSGVGQLGSTISSMNGGKPLFGGGGSSGGGDSPVPGSSSSTSQFGGLGANLHFSHGGTVPGQEVVPGDSPQNDVVDAKLSAGEIVLPKSAAQNPKKAAKFVEKEKKEHKILGPLADLFKSLHEIHK